MAARPEYVNAVPIPYGLHAAALEALVESDARERWAALIALGHDPSSEALAALIRAARHSDPHIRRAGIEALALHVRGREAGQIAIDGLEDVSMTVVRTACETVAALGLQAAHSRILRLLRDPAPATRQAAIRALDSLWTPEDFAIVLALFLEERDAATRKETAWILRSHVTTSTWRRLFEAWRTDDVHRHRLWACELAGQFGEPDILPALRELERDQDGLVRRTAEQAARRLVVG
jgi:HEAT repeat protein